MLPLYNKYNFHNGTFCIWNQVDIELIKNLKINYKSKSGSSYVFVDEGIYRISNHWGRISNCRWKLNSNSNYKNQSTTVGFAKWNDFFINDETSKLFFIKVDFDNKSVAFSHKNSEDYDGKAIVRNAKETSKIIQTIKIILNKKSWSTHLNYDNFEELQKEIIYKLINSERSFLAIKQDYF